MKNNRLASIDIFRALTMMLMIFVIDAENLLNIPGWLGHAAAEDDRMGLADIVFPCFMFIIGLSIPYAVKVRISNGESIKNLSLHFLSRSISLIIMGLYVVNMDNMNAASMIINKGYWQLLLVVAIILIWNNYQSQKIMQIIPIRIMQALGWVLLIFLAYIYKGPADSWMQTHWWGILGLLGWSYGLCAAIFLFVGNRLIGLAIAALILLILNINEFVGGFNLRLVISASNYFSVMIGVFCSVLYLQISETKNIRTAFSVLACMAIALIAFGILTRPEWGISKIRATPSWTTICAGISILCFLIMVVIADIRKFVTWAKPLAAGGYATLTCYFALYLVYSIMQLVGLSWPDSLLTGGLGLVKSICFSLMVIQLAALAGKINIKLSL